MFSPQNCQAATVYLVHISPTFPKPEFKGKLHLDGPGNSARCDCDLFGDGENLRDPLFKLKGDGES